MGKVSQALGNYLLAVNIDAKLASDTAEKIDIIIKDSTGVAGSKSARAIRVLVEDLGKPAIVLDQFEEVLDDPKLGDAAVRVVEDAFAEHGEQLRQMLSMRLDRRHLLEPFVSGRIGLSDGRMYTLQPLGRATLEQVIEAALEEADEESGHAVPRLSRQALELLLGEREPEALVVNAVLHYLYRDALGDTGDQITHEAVRELLARHGGRPEGVLETWIADCLERPSVDSGASLSRTSFWPGPRPYDWRRERFFKGRDAEIDTLGRWLEDKWFSVLLAASGSGKTSLLQAGLMPRMRRDRLREIAFGQDPRSLSYVVCVNQWNRRALSDVSFDDVFPVELRDSLLASVDWYRAHASDKVNAGQYSQRDLAGGVGEEAAQDLMKFISDPQAVRHDELGAAGGGIGRGFPIPLPARAQDSGATHELRRSEVVGASKSMAQKMSARLVSYSNLKRPVEFEELREAAFAESIPRQMHLRAELPLGESWVVPLVAAGPIRGAFDGSSEGKNVERVLDATFEATLDAMVEGFVLKRSGQTYELIHDGFSSPLHRWAASWEESPQARFGLLYGETGAYIPFRFPAVVGDLDSPVVRGLVWRSCIVDSANLGGISFVDCDFTGTEFRGCVFHAAEGHPLFDNCTFDDARLTMCVIGRDANARQRVQGTSFARSRWDRCGVRHVDFVHEGDAAVSFASAEITGGTIEECTFKGVSAGNMQVGPKMDGPEDSWSPIRFLGKNVFSGKSELMGAAMYGCGSGVEGAPSFVFEGPSVSKTRKPRHITVEESALGFEDCNMTAMRIESIDLSSTTVTLRECNLQGAYFREVEFRAPSEDKPVFSGCAIGGGALVGCGVQGAFMAGGPNGPTNARSLLITESRLSNAVFRSQDCDGMRLEECELDGMTAFIDCRLSRVSIGALSGEGTVDLQQSALSYARLEDEGSHLLLAPGQSEDQRVARGQVAAVAEAERALGFSG